MINNGMEGTTSLLLPFLFSQCKMTSGLTTDIWHWSQHTSLVRSRVYYCRNQIRKIRQNCKNILTTFTCQHTLAFTCSLSQMDPFPTNLSFWSIWVFFFLLFFYTGLEPYMVHCQSRPYPVFPEHSAGVGPLCLSVVAGSILLPSSLLP